MQVLNTTFVKKYVKLRGGNGMFEALKSMFDVFYQKGKESQRLGIDAMNPHEREIMNLVQFCKDRKYHDILIDGYNKSSITASNKDFATARQLAMGRKCYERVQRKAKLHYTVEEMSLYNYYVDVYKPHISMYRACADITKHMRELLDDIYEVDPANRVILTPTQIMKQDSKISKRISAVLADVKNRWIGSHASKSDMADKLINEMKKAINSMNLDTKPDRVDIELKYPQTLVFGVSITFGCRRYVTIV